MKEGSPEEITRDKRLYRRIKDRGESIDVAVEMAIAGRKRQSIGEKETACVAHTWNGGEKPCNCETTSVNRRGGYSGREGTRERESLQIEDGLSRYKPCVKLR